MGTKTTEALNRLEGKVRDLLQEIQDLKVYVCALEEENARIRSELFQQHQEYQGYENLLQIYEDGFHVCPVHFGSTREDQDCLFCLSFLTKRGFE